MNSKIETIYRLWLEYGNVLDDSKNSDIVNKAIKEFLGKHPTIDAAVIEKTHASYFDLCLYESSNKALLAKLEEQVIKILESNNIPIR